MTKHEETHKFLVGIFNDEDILIGAIKKLQAAGVKLHDAYTPYPVHHLDEYLGFKRSRLSKAAFLFGATGAILAATFQSYVMGIDWPMIIGGKDFIAPPSFVPVTFEFAVLCASLGMVATFLVSNGLLPWKKAVMFDPRSTDDKFVLAINLADNKKIEEAKIVELLKANGAEEVNTKEIKKK
ncbi:MAG: DUF3341 domain-containing protein [Microscillaceae bacterium]|nr:DUF3341 domain-containing protein [Microscillaceae bacterium]MDW8461722.1 DUF3341 domain-containing protein [Cytophagales bacterium]